MPAFEFKVTPKQGTLSKTSTVGGFTNEGDAEAFRILLEDLLFEATLTGLLTGFKIEPVQESPDGHAEADDESTLSSVFHQLVESVR